MIRRLPLWIFALSIFSFVFSEFEQCALAQSSLTEEQLTVILKDFSVNPSTDQATAGRVTLVAVNQGKQIHELVILKTDLSPAALPRIKAKDEKGIASEYLVNEDDARIETIDEIEEFQAGTSQKKTVVLEPGHYVLFCNIPGHYDKGMYTSLHIMTK